VCISLAQTTYRYEVRLRTGLLGEPAKHIRPLSETRAIESGANVLAEGFLFSVAAALIIGETWRSARSQSKQRSDVNESIERLRTQVRELDGRLQISEEAAAEERRRYQEIASILDHIVEIGLRSGWAQLQDDSPRQIPHLQSNLPQLKSPLIPQSTAECSAPLPYPVDTVPSSGDTRSIS